MFNSFTQKTELQKVLGFHNLNNVRGPSWSWSYGSWIYKHLCNQCLSPLKSCEFEPIYGKVYSIQHYVIKFISDLRQVGGFHNKCCFFYRRLKKTPLKLCLLHQLQFVTFCYIHYQPYHLARMFISLFLAMNNLALNKYFVYVVELKKIISENNCILRSCCFMLLKLKILWEFCQGNYEKKF